MAEESKGEEESVTSTVHSGLFPIEIDRGYVHLWLTLQSTRVYPVQSIEHDII